METQPHEHPNEIYGKMPSYLHYKAQKNKIQLSF